jgi:hypothetical protein
MAIRMGTIKRAGSLGLKLEAASKPDKLHSPPGVCDYRLLLQRRGGILFANMTAAARIAP